MLNASIVRVHVQREATRDIYHETNSPEKEVFYIFLFFLFHRLDVHYLDLVDTFLSRRGEITIQNNTREKWHGGSHAHSVSNFT